MESLTVKYNNDKSRDFTNPNLPSGDSGSSSSSHAGTPGDSHHILFLTPPSPPKDGSGYPYGGAYAQQSLAMAGAAGYPQAMSSVAMGAMGYGQQSLGPTVLIVSGLDESRVNPDILFT